MNGQFKIKIKTMTALVWYIPWIQIYWLKLSRKKNKLISDVEVVKVVVNPLCACYRFAHGVISMNCSEQLVHIPNHSASTPHRLSESIAYVIHVLLVGISQNDRLSIHVCAFAVHAKFACQNKKFIQCFHCHLN